MKLDSFFNKSKIRKVPSKVISFVNEVQENAWRAEVQKLQAELDRLKTVDAERTEFSQRMYSAEIQLHETREKETTLQAQKDLLEGEVKQGEVLRTENQGLTNGIKDLRGQLGIKDSHLEQAAHNNLELNKQVEQLAEQLLEISKIEKSLRQGLEESIQRAASNKHELQETNSKFSELGVKLSTTTVTYDNLKNDYDKLSIVAEYWRKVSETLQAENDDLGQTSVMLQQLKKDVKVERTQQKGISKVKKGELETVQGKLTAMAEALEYLTYKNSYFLSVISTLKKEVAKPRYLSMGSIAQKEGFKMPLGNENVRKQFLGTSTPTLLKFKAKEDGNDN